MMGEEEDQDRLVRFSRKDERKARNYKSIRQFPEILHLKNIVILEMLAGREFMLSASDKNYIL